MCIKRDDMPQVDGEDLAGLIAHLNSHGVMCSNRELPVEWIKPKQCLKDIYPASNPALKRKPILISFDMYILDGNHRWAMWKQDGGHAPCIEVGCSFERAVDLILTYPKAYRLGDGPQPTRD